MSYKPSQVQYRDLVVDRIQLVVFRRQLIDRLTNLLPESKLFKTDAFYPKRYFDDLMTQEQLTSFDKYQQMKAVDSRRGLYYSETLDKLNSPKILNSNSSNILHLPDISGNKNFQFQSNRNLDLQSAFTDAEAHRAEERDSMASLDNLLGLRATDIFNAELKRMHEIRKTNGAS